MKTEKDLTYRDNLYAEKKCEKQMTIVIDGIDMLMFRKFFIRKEGEEYICDGTINHMIEDDELPVRFGFSETYRIFEILGNHWGGWNDCPSWEVMQAKAKEWFEKYEAEIVKLAHDAIWFKCTRHLNEGEVEELIQDFSQFAPNSVDIADTIRERLSEQGEFVLWWD